MYEKNIIREGYSLTPIIRITLFLALAVCWLFLHGQFVYAADIASGTSGTCSWVIDEDGTLTIRPTDGVSGTLESQTMNEFSWYSNRTSVKKVVIEPGVKTAAGCYKMFSEFAYCTEMDLRELDTSGTTDMSFMFRGCSRLTSLDVSGFDTGNVTNMNSMFRGCSSLTSLDVSSFNTEKVTLMTSMFYDLQSIKSLDLSQCH